MGLGSRQNASDSLSGIQMCDSRRFVVRGSGEGSLTLRGTAGYIKLEAEAGTRHASPSALAEVLQGSGGWKY